MREATVARLSVQKHRPIFITDKLNQGLPPGNSRRAALCHLISGVRTLDEIPTGDTEGRS